MAMISPTPQSLASTRAYTVVAKHADQTVHAFAGDEALSAAISPINGGPTLATPTVAFVSPSAGTLTVTVKAGQVAALRAGTYELEVLATPKAGDYAGEPLSVWKGTIAFASGPSASAASTPGWARWKFEKVLVFRRLGWMLLSGLDTSWDGGNQDLNGPIAASIEYFGGSTADPDLVADADLLTVGGQERSVLELADLLLLEAILGNQASVTLSYGTSKANYDNLAGRVMAELARVEAKCKRVFGYGLATPTLGVTDLGFQQTDDDDLPTWEVSVP